MPLTPNEITGDDAKRDAKFAQAARLYDQIQQERIGIQLQLNALYRVPWHSEQPFEMDEPTFEEPVKMVSVLCRRSIVLQRRINRLSVMVINLQLHYGRAAMLELARTYSERIYTMHQVLKTLKAVNEPSPTRKN